MGQPQPRFHPFLPYTSPAFLPHTAPRRTTADYDNERVIRDLKMLTEDRHYSDPRGSPPIESSQIASPIPSNQNSILDSIRRAKATARARGTPLYTPTASSPPNGFDLWGHRIPNTSFLTTSGGAAQNPRPHSGSCS
jgi:hypothetical protein